MTLEETFEALMKNFEATTTNIKERKNQNAYLRCQLAESMRQKGRNLVSLSSSPVLTKRKELREIASIWSLLVRRSLLGD